MYFKFIVIVLVYWSEGVLGQESCADRSCYPEIGDLLIGRDSPKYLITNSTCGLDSVEKYCIISHLDDITKCFRCDSRRDYDENVEQTHQSHRIANIVSTFRKDWKRRWWQAENSVENVYIQLNLNAEFRFTHLIMRFKTFRPAAMYIERSYTFEKTWEVYRYFSDDCEYDFPGISTGPMRNISDVICESRYSAIDPSTEGEVVFRALPPFMNIPDPYSQDVQNLIKLTNLRVVFKRLHTLGDDKLGERADVNQKYYYAMYDMVVRGSCSCYGHASRCLPLPDEEERDGDRRVQYMVYGKCECQHNTAGSNCERCQDFYNDLPWRPAIGGDVNSCRECTCNGHSTRCHFDAAVYELTGQVSGGVCDDCMHNTRSKNCDECIPRYYRDPNLPLSHPSVCQPCNCDPDGSEHGGECESHTDPVQGLVAGRCICKRFVMGRRCDVCQDGYWNMRADNRDGCQMCQCMTAGTFGDRGCDKGTGQCSCKRYITGQRCDRCHEQYWGLQANEPDGCKPCDCDVGGALDNNCDAVTGQCNCRPNIWGRRCDRPMDGYFVPTLDYLVYEAENDDVARGIGNTVVIIREPVGQPTWTGPGFMKVTEGDSIEFTVTNVPLSMEYDIVVRYESQMPRTWEDIRMTLIRPGPMGYRCHNELSHNDNKALTLPRGQRYTVVTPSACLEQGVTYKIRLDFNAYQGSSTNRGASVLIDSIVLMPHPRSIPIYSDNSAVARRMLEEFTRYQCYENQLDAVDQPISDVCRRHIFSVSAVMFQQALECACERQGSTSGVCQSLGGQCECRNNILGRRCDQCSPGHYGFGNDRGCLPCNCDAQGSRDNLCDVYNGQCLCISSNIVGRQCERCSRGYYNFPTCLPCSCNGRAAECNDLTGGCLQCRDNTGGQFCERCADGYYGDASPTSRLGCRPCLCPGGAGSGYQHTNECRLDTFTNTVQCSCPVGYRGPDCSRCDEGYFGNPNQPGGTCRPCQCNGNIDPRVPGSCDPVTGRCLRCQYNTEGDRCDRCRDGYHGDATRQQCTRCVCFALGWDTEAGECDHRTGQCPCLPNVVGRECEECAVNHWKIASGKGCEFCDCDPSGSRSQQCNQFTGQCDCVPGRGGRDCRECPANYYGDPRVQCLPCNCNREGSQTQQCDRRTGQCQCVEGVAGEKCDRCARGTTGDLPYCVPCGECFDDWDSIIAGLKNRTQDMSDEAEKIKIDGAPSAYDKEFREMEEKLAEVERILAGTNISSSDLQDIQNKIDQLRANLTASNNALSTLDDDLADSVARIQRGRNDLTVVRRRVDDIKVKAEQLRNNATGVKALDPAGAYNLTLDAERRSRRAEQTAEDAMDVVGESERTRNQAEKLLNDRRNQFNDTLDDNELKLGGIMAAQETMKDNIQTLNRQVCGRRVDWRNVDPPCDDVCGGAGCGRCGGGLSCDGTDFGAVSKANKALQYAKDADKLLQGQGATGQSLKTQVQQAQAEAAEALADAQMAYDEAALAKNTSETARVELRDLIERITDFLSLDKAQPDQVRQIAEEVLAMTISLTPDEIRDLANQINDTIRGLTDIDQILADTKDDLETATRLKQRADRAKVAANDVLGSARGILDALEEARIAQQAAERATASAQDNTTIAEQHLLRITVETDAGGSIATDSISRLEDLMVRLEDLKVKYKQMEDSVRVATQVAQEAADAADRTEQAADDLEARYDETSVQLDAKWAETQTLKERADSLRQRAQTLYQDYYLKLKRLEVVEREFENTEKFLVDYSAQIAELTGRMDKYMVDIQEVARFHRTCT